MGNWPYLLVIAALTAVAAALTAWVKGFFSALLPPPSLLALTVKDCIAALRDAYIRPKSERFVVLIASLSGDDPNRSHSAAIERALRGDNRIERKRLYRLIWPSDASTSAETASIHTAQNILVRRKADILIWGEVIQKEKLLNLWFTSRDSELVQYKFELQANLLGADFEDVTATLLVALALSAIRPITERSTEALGDALRLIVTKIRRLLAETHKFTARQQTDLRFALGVALVAMGTDLGDVTVLSDAAAFLSQAADSIDRLNDPLSWARCQHYLGVALQVRGKADIGANSLWRAIDAFNVALEERDKEASPLEWAETQNSLGITLSNIGNRESNIGYLTASIDAFDHALDVRTLTALPIDWAKTTNNRSLSVLAIGKLKGRAQAVQEAISSLRGILQNIRRGETPDLWAGVNNNIGIALIELAQIDGDREHLDEALTSLRTAQWEWVRDRVPAKWGMAQANIGTALLLLGDSAGNIAQIGHALETYRTLATIYDRDTAPLMWATQQIALANALVKIGEIEGEQSQLGGRIVRFGSLSDSESATDWVAVQKGLVAGVEREERRAVGFQHLEEAVSVFRAAFEALNREDNELLWIRAQIDFSGALLRFGEQHDGVEFLKDGSERVKVVCEALAREEFSDLWMLANRIKGKILHRIGERENDAATLDLSVQQLHMAMDAKRQPHLPIEKARIEHDLGTALLSLGMSRSDINTLKEARNYLSEARRIYASIPSPKNLEWVDNNIRMADSQIQLLQAQV